MNISDFIAIDIVTITIGILLSLFFIYASIISLFEKEKRASSYFLVIAFVVLIVYLVVGISEFPYQNYMSAILVIIASLSLLIFLIPIPVSSKIENINFNLSLDENIPRIKINEFVVWEVLEPLIQNSIDHAPNHNIIVSIATKFNSTTKQTKIIIGDDGNGISNNLLEKDKNGIQKLFLENITTKNVVEKSTGYGCYIAYQLSTKRCGWNLYAENLEKGCQFVLTIQN